MQDQCSPDNPEEHFLWALQLMPTMAGIGAVTNTGFLRQWSKHLWKAGFVHRDYIAAKADDDGNIHVDQLPPQQIKLQKPFRGPRHQYNNAARWVDANTPDPEPTRLPDVRRYTDQERQAMADQLIAVGAITPAKLVEHAAQIVN
jgi:hypothetical protein